MSLFKKKKLQAANSGPNKFNLEASASVEILQAAEGEGVKRPTFTIDAYNGGPLSVGGFYRPVVVDLSGLRANMVTVLRDHDSSKIVGQGKAKISKSNITVTGQVTGDFTDKNDPSYGVVSHSKNGFIWAASVGVSIDQVSYVDEGEKVKVNGQIYEGPIYVVRKGRLGEVSFVGIGADETASAKIAASAAENVLGENDMNFEQWLKAMGLTQDDLNDGQRVLMQAKYEAEQNPVVPEPEKLNVEDEINPVEQRRIEAAAEETRIGEIRTVCGSAHTDICAKAIKEGWTKDQAEVAVMKAERPKAPEIKTSTPIDSTPMVIEAALCMSAGMRDIEKMYPEKVLEAARKDYRRLSLQQLLLRAASDAGVNVRVGDRIHNGNIKTVLQAAFSTVDISGILSNVANKYLISSFNAVEQAWRQIAAIRSVSDFKTITSYRLTGGGGYEKVGPGGEIKHGTLGESSFTNKAETYGEMLAITRQDIINDDLGALTGGATQKLGRDAGLKLNSVFWTEFLDNSSFFTGSNVSATSSLSVSGLEKAVIKFYKLKDAAGKFIGTMPEILLVPVDLEMKALQLFRDTLVNEAATAGSPSPNGNPHSGKYRPVSSRYLSDSTITGYSATSYYLLANPQSVPSIEVAFLDGKDMPTIETADVDFNTLGIQMRGYFDFGVSKQDSLAGIKATA